MARVRIPLSLRLTSKGRFDPPKGDLDQRGEQRAALRLSYDEHLGQQSQSDKVELIVKQAVSQFASGHAFSGRPVAAEHRDLSDSQHRV